MEIQGRRRSSNIEDRGAGTASRGSGIPIQALRSIVRMLGPKGTFAVAAIAAVGYFALPAGLRQQLLGQLLGGQAAGAGKGQSKVCEASPKNAQACDFSATILASTEDVWDAQFQRQALPNYGKAAGSYRHPTLVIFANAVNTGGCGSATSAVGPFYCSGDQKLYIDPSFYDVMEQRLKAPGDFAQAYVIAHEVGHHVQNLIGSSRLNVKGETKNQISVRVELQADCLAGIWGHTARASLAIDEQDLKEAVNAAHAIGDDTLGHSNQSDYTHGTSAQRIRWFRRGYTSGDARQCDTFAVTDYGQL